MQESLPGPPYTDFENAQVKNSLILKVNDIAIFGAEFPFFFSYELIDSAKSRLHIKQKNLLKLVHGKVAVKQRECRENTGNLKAKFQWWPCSAFSVHIFNLYRRTMNYNEIN